MSKRANPALASGDPGSEAEEEQSAIRRVPASVMEQVRDDPYQHPSDRPTLVEAPAIDDQDMVRDTIPCAGYSLPPNPRLSTPDLERTLRFARLVLETLEPSHHVAHLLELAIIRRDAALLQALMRHLNDLQQRAADGETSEAERSERPTILPPPPSGEVAVPKLGNRR